MKALSIAFALVLAACSPPAAPPAAEAPAVSVADATSDKPTDAAPAPPATSAPGAITAEALVGRWGDNGDCTKDIVFAADGTFRSYTGGSGRWSLNGDRVTMAGQGGTFEVRVESLNATQLIVGNPDGSFGISQRC